VGSNSLRGHRKRGECGHEEQESEVVDFTVEELPYRQTRSTLLDDSDPYFGTDRIVFVRSMVRVWSIWLLFPTVLTRHLGFSVFRPCRRLTKGVASVMIMRGSCTGE
jgi:hypothetical protein